MADISEVQAVFEEVQALVEALLTVIIAMPLLLAAGYGLILLRRRVRGLHRPLIAEDGPDMSAFERYWREELSPWLARQERRRLVSLAVLFGGLAVSQPLVAILGYPMLTEGGPFGWLILGDMALIAALVGAHLRLARDIKAHLMPRIVSHFGLRPEARLHDLPERLRALGLLDGGAARVEDNFGGEHGGVSVAVGEVVRYRPVKYGEEIMSRHIVFAFGFHKPFSGRTLVLPDRGTVGNALLPVSVPAGLARVRLEDPEFESLFEVFASDQVEARYLLTPAFMERLAATRALFAKAPVAAAFVEDTLYVMVDTQGADWFEAGSLLLRRVDDRDRVMRLAAQVAVVIEMVDALALTLKTRV